MKTFGLVGWSGSGKTTLVAKLVPELIGRGFTCLLYTSDAADE